MRITDTTLELKALEIHRRLLDTYGERPLKHTREPLRTLIGTMLSHRTTNAATRQAFDRMWARYGGWDAIRLAPVDELIETLSGVTYPEVKGPNIQRTLTRIIEERGEFALDFLRDRPVEEALAWLLTLPGVGLKTATLVLLFVFAMPVLPVDTHVHRVSQRLGLIGPRDSAEKAHAKLLALLPSDAAVLYNFHLNMIEHGQRVCVWGEPRCHDCPLTDICDWYQANRAT